MLDMEVPETASWREVRAGMGGGRPSRLADLEFGQKFLFRGGAPVMK
jgi:hypothetical protein